MGAKEDLLANIIRHDKSGAVQSIHDKLIEAGLKWKGPSNSETLLYLFRLDGKEVGVAAMRRGIFSFPKSFWGPRGSALHKALSNVPTYTRINVEPAISSSQLYLRASIQLARFRYRVQRAK
ncbi:hypothetical protein ACED29_12365 [Shewanella sp. 5S214]|uniref:hypothetical protein n=1 Tax=Shewanella sp. 5S214 TaxID=3229999 RepID=UPI00352D32E9